MSKSDALCHDFFLGFLYFFFILFFFTSFLCSKSKPLNTFSGLVSLCYSQRSILITFDKLHAFITFHKIFCSKALTNQ